ncbi:MAG: hypothetical protein H6Q74_2857 [Firmicutes bacterium]|nr:hypothetical protein [Bacillota bacterium]
MSAIYYYSATGNSLYAAKTLAANIGSQKVAPMAAALGGKDVVAPEGSLGLVFPMHYFGLPPVVSAFIDQIDLTAVKYIFAVVTCGSQFLSSSLHQLNRELSAKNRALDAGFYLEMVSNYIPLSDMPAPAKLAAKLAQADEKLQQITANIAGQVHNVEAEYLYLPCRLVNQYWRKNLRPKTYHKFSSTAECTSCGLCRQVCPVHNISLASGKPQWGKNCQECLACLHICPAGCIEFGSRTVGRVRYRHPKITAQELTTGKQK